MFRVKCLEFGVQRLGLRILIETCFRVECRYDRSNRSGCGRQGFACKTQRRSRKDPKSSSVLEAMRCHSAWVKLLLPELEGHGDLVTRSTIGIHGVIICVI